MFRALVSSSLSIMPILRNAFPIFRLIVSPHPVVPRTHSSLYAQPNEFARRTEAAQSVARRVGMQLIAEKKAAVLRAAALSGGEKEISGKSLHDRDLLTLLIKANMSTDIPEHQRLSDDDVLARAYYVPLDRVVY